MRKKKLNKDGDIDVAIGAKVWSKKHMAIVRAHIISESKKQTPERKLINELLSIKYRIEDLIEKIKETSNKDLC